MTLRGDSELGRRLNALAGISFEDASLDAVNELANAIEPLIPKQSGELAEALTVQRSENGAEVGFDSDGAHAHLVEFGHEAQDGTFVPPNPFMRPALDASANRMRVAFQKRAKLTIGRKAK